VARCAAASGRMKAIERKLVKAIDGADARGYTGYVGSKGGLFDDPVVAKLMRRRDLIIKRCGGSRR